MLRGLFDNEADPCNLKPVTCNLQLQITSIRHAVLFSVDSDSN